MATSAPNELRLDVDLVDGDEYVVVGGYSLTFDIAPRLVVGNLTDGRAVGGSL